MDWEIIEREWRFGGTEWKITIPPDFWDDVKKLRREGRNEEARALEIKKLGGLWKQWMEQHPKLRQIIAENSDWMYYLPVNAMLAQWGLLDNEVAIFFLGRILRYGRREAWKYIGMLRQRGEDVAEDELESTVAVAYALTIRRLIDEGIDAVEKVVAYALVVLKRELLDRLDKLDRVEKPQGEYVSLEDRTVVPPIDDTAGSPEETIAEDDAVRKVRDLLHSLPEGRQREIARLRFEEGLTRKDIASRCGVSTKTVQREENAIIAHVRKHLKIND